MTQETAQQFVYLHPNQIKEEWNVREDYGEIENLAESILEIGVQNPIRVFKNSNDEFYYLTDGHRRHAATKEALQYAKNEIYIPAIIEQQNNTEANRVIDQLILNNGKDLTALEQSIAIDKAVNNYGWDVNTIAKRVGKSNASIYYYLKLSSSVPELKKALKNEELTFGAALDIIKQNDTHTKQLDALNKLREKNNKDSNNKSKKIGQRQTNKKGRITNLYNKIIEKTNEKNVSSDKINMLKMLSEYEKENLHFGDLIEFIEKD